ncbi:MAG TPA: hypothetical protein VFZ48_01055 [Candidatus Saccharimonadales bacterium]
MAKQKNDNGKSNGGNPSNNGGGNKTRSNDIDSKAKNKLRKDKKDQQNAAARARAQGRKEQAARSKRTVVKVAKDQPAQTDRQLEQLRQTLHSALGEGVDSIIVHRRISEDNRRAKALLQFTRGRLTAATAAPCGIDDVIDAFESFEHNSLGDQGLIPQSQLRSLRKLVRDLQILFVEECRRINVRPTEMLVLKQKWYRGLKSELAQATKAAQKSTTKDNGTTPQVKTQPEPAAQAA